MDWLDRPENRDYYRGVQNAERVRAWRGIKTPVNFRKPKKITAQVGVQNSIILDDAIRQRLIRTLPRLSVQDVIIPENVLLLGFIAEITGDTVQNLIAKTLPRLFSRGRHALNCWLQSEAQKLEA
jgi:hypothetical protein